MDYLNNLSPQNDLEFPELMSGQNLQYLRWLAEIQQTFNCLEMCYFLFKII